MSTFITLTIYGDATEIYVNMDHVLQMYEDSEFVRFKHIPEGDPAEECHFTRLVYTDAAKENILTDQVIEPVKEILELIENANP
jgi:hypothetical protein